MDDLPGGKESGFYYDTTPEFDGNPYIKVAPRNYCESVAVTAQAIKFGFLDVQIDCKGASNKKQDELAKSIF